MSGVPTLGACNPEHAMLVAHARRWLNRKCAVVITDMSHGGRETPDAIGWYGWQSTVIECKTSVSDFKADLTKSFRVYPEEGMGHKRYYFARVGLLRAEALPAGWGLLEWTGKRILVSVESAFHERRSDKAEISLLLSAMCRIGATAPQGISCRFYTKESGNRATLGVEL